jgi:hypothetical protein
LNRGKILAARSREATGDSSLDAPDRRDLPEPDSAMTEVPGQAIGRIDVSLEGGPLERSKDLPFHAPEVLELASLKERSALEGAFDALHHPLTNFFSLAAGDTS